MIKRPLFFLVNQCFFFLFGLLLAGGQFMNSVNEVGFGREGLRFICCDLSKERLNYKEFKTLNFLFFYS
jgi:hypothetical protein